MESRMEPRDGGIKVTVVSTRVVSTRSYLNAKKENCSEINNGFTTLST